MEIKLYCKKCGKELFKKEVPRGYDRTSGEKLIMYYYLCSNWKSSTESGKEHDCLKEDSPELTEVIRLANLAQKNKEYKEKQAKVKLLVKEIRDLGYLVEVKEVL